MELLDGEVFDVDIKLDNGCINRAVEIVNAKLKAIGLRLEFSKVSKVKKRLFLKKASIFAKDINDLDRRYLFVEKLGDKPLFQKKGYERPLTLFKDTRPTLFTEMPKRTLFKKEE